MVILGYNPSAKDDDLPLACQVNQIPTTAMRLAEMPKTICMAVSSCMVMCHCVLRVGLGG